ncbi:hypothetical protein Bca52824_083496 [Brassica carinata]|uniref:Uncharacterized protein n=1 Tax=Brassica carinata TaxID=52824 RepID=A0A8X7PLH9_BRACI|nr:hypothetical protein Bca52824_083496 [Brassica carinata]
MPVSRSVSDVSEQLVQPLEIATKMVLNPVNLLFSPLKGKKGRQGQHHSGQRMQHQDRFMAPKLTRY